MAMKVTAMAALAKVCHGFSTGNLRAQVPSQQQVADSLVSQSVPPVTAAPSTASISVVAATAAVGAMAAVGAAAAPRTRRSRTTTYVAGVSGPFFDGFDPLNFGSTDAKMDRYTAVEIKHGRVAMIACVGYWLPEAFRFPGCENFDNGLGALATIPVEGWVQLVAFIGAHDVLVKPRADGLGSYDFGLGTELIEGIPAEELERRQTVERNNGRLAMIAIMGMMVQDGMFGMNPVALYREQGWWGGPTSWLVQDIPMCNTGLFQCAVGKPKSSPGLTACRAVVYEDPMPAVEYHQKMSPACPYLKYPSTLDGWVGGEKGFDPLNVTMALPVYMVREAELKHGRVCMLATVGWLATDLGARFPGDVFANSSTIGAHDACVQAGYMQPLLAFVGVLELYSGWLWFQGFSGEIDRKAGDFFVGKQFLPKDEEKARDMQLKELENGRLSMLAFSGICTQAVGFDKGFPYL